MHHLQFIYNMFQEDLDDYEDDPRQADIRLLPGSRIPKAPAPKAAAADTGPWGQHLPGPII